MRAGSNCGSCRPELQALIAQNRLPMAEGHRIGLEIIPGMAHSMGQPLTERGLVAAVRVKRLTKPALSFVTVPRAVRVVKLDGSTGIFTGH